MTYRAILWQGVLASPVDLQSAAGRERVDVELRARGHALECAAHRTWWHCHTVHLPLGALLTPCTMCGTGAAPLTVRQAVDATLRSLNSSHGERRVRLVPGFYNETLTPELARTMAPAAYVARP